MHGHWFIFGGQRWASEGEPGGFGPRWILKLLAKKVVFSISRGKNQISPLLTPLEKILSNPPTCPPWKKSFRRPWG